jgi:hypothetical protein
VDWAYEFEKFAICITVAFVIVMLVMIVSGRRKS